MNRIFTLLTLLVALGVQSQTKTFWQVVSEDEIATLPNKRKAFELQGATYMYLDVAAIQQQLMHAPVKFSGQNGVIVNLPGIDGQPEAFEVFENSNFTADMQAKYPQIRAYVGKGITVPGAVINFSVAPNHFETITFYPGQPVLFVEPVDMKATAYALFSRDNKVTLPEPFNCTSPTTLAEPEVGLSTNPMGKADNQKYKTMKLALSATAEYANYFGATASNPDTAAVITAMNATMTRVNGVMERDLAIHLNMIDNTNLIYFDPASDPYSDAANMNNWNQELQTNLTSTIGNTPYDIGHLFGASGGGGNAGCIGCVCVNPTTSNPLGKGSGITSPGTGGPLGDSFDIDYVAHEMGHQMGGNHTFTYSYEGTVAQTEPASGTTIMGYAGVTGSYDIQAHSDVLYSFKSITQIQTNMNTKMCPVTTTMTNNAPTANAGADYTIPKSTPFVLTGVGADVNTSDVLTYVWEQADAGSNSLTNANSRTYGTKATGPTFRTFSTVTTPVRYFPQMSRILTNSATTSSIVLTTTNNTSIFESLSSVARTLKFNFTVRDNVAGGGQTKQDAMKVTVDATKGPLTVTSQATTGISYQGNSVQTVTWDVNSTNTITGADTVDILLATPVSGNNTNFSYVLATAVPNSGTAQVTMPNIAASTCRIMVKATNNIFFNINYKNFAITALGAESFNFADFVLAPNPNNGQFNLQFTPDSDADIQIAIHDMRGRLIMNKSYQHSGLFNEQISLDSTVESGIYMVSIVNGDKKMVRKIVKN